MTKEEAEARPAGPARDDPNMNPTLEPPKSVLCLSVSLIVLLGWISVCNGMIYCRY